jgi:hypothetical protein
MRVVRAMVSSARFYPKGTMGVDQAALWLARSKYPHRWDFGKMDTQERDVWQGMNVTFNGAIIDVEHSLRTKALGDPNSLERYCDFSEAVRELRQALYAGDLVAFFIDENGNQDFIRPNSWGSDDAPVVILSGLADLDDGYCRLILLRDADLKRLFGRGFGHADNLGIPKSRTPSKTELERWYLQRIQEFEDRRTIPSLEQDLRDAIAKFPGVTREMVRNARRELAPKSWGKRGPRGPRKSI